MNYQWDIVDGYMNWYRQISHSIIQNPFDRSSTPYHMRGEDVDAIVLAQVFYFLSILYIFTSVNRSC